MGTLTVSLAHLNLSMLPFSHSWWHWQKRARALCGTRGRLGLVAAVVLTGCGGLSLAALHYGARSTSSGGTFTLLSPNPMWTTASGPGSGFRGRLSSRTWE
jgi:hypothetical protein